MRGTTKTLDTWTITHDVVSVRLLCEDRAASSEKKTYQIFVTWWLWVCALRLDFVTPGSKREIRFMSFWLGKISN